MIKLADTNVVTDPIAFQRALWPDISFYEKQIEVIESVAYDDMTVVPAGNMLGKDFVAGFIVVWFFCSRRPCRIVTTSAKDDHLRVLWGEIKRFIQTASIPLTVDKGGPLIVNHREIKWQNSDGTICPLSYIRGAVASSDSIASMQGHHIANKGDGVARTLFVSDESSSVPDEYWTMAKTWAKRALIIGNPWDCSNFFYKSVKGDPVTRDQGGDLFSDDGKRCYRRVIRIRAEDSPNVQLGLMMEERGLEYDGTILIDGVKDYDEYRKNRKTWDPIQQCVSLDGDFYEGLENKLYPPEWLSLSHRKADLLKGKGRSRKRYMGIDVGEGGDATVWTVIDRLGIIEQKSMKTPDTSVIPGITLSLIKKHKIDSKDVLFDRGGGGFEHANYLRSKGHMVRSVGFGEAASPAFITKRIKSTHERTEEKETQYVYKNRRAEMYGILRRLLDPMQNPMGFAIPLDLTDLIFQLKPLPLLFDEEGRLYLPPKDKRNKDSKVETLKQLLGRSPDEADSLVLATFGLERVKLKLKLKSY
jgi:hypothetical protein